MIVVGKRNRLYVLHFHRPNARLLGARSVSRQFPEGHFIVPGNCLTFTYVLPFPVESC